MSNSVLSGRYEIVEKIGEGGMAKVYKAKDRLLNRYIAIKILRLEYIKDEEFIENFKKESQAAAALSHPNIVNIFDVGKDGDYHYIVMELVEGKTLSQIIEEKGHLDYKETINITKQVAAALSIAHKNQIIHRDVKPHNILITNTGVAKLADFGIARAVSNSTMVEGKNKVMGSVHYFSPEQARGAYVDERSDIYSLGIVMYEMLTGKVPFDGDSAVSIALKHINDPMPSPSSIVAGVPPQLERIIMKATDKYQSNRFKSADELIEALDNMDFIGKVIGKSAFINADEAANSRVEDIKSYEKLRADLSDMEEHKKVVKPEKRKPEEDKKKISKGSIVMMIIAAIVLIAGIVGFGFLNGWFGGGNEVQVPKFVGMTLEEAQAEAETQGLQIEQGESVYSPDQEKGKITSQSPSEGAMVVEGKTITVNISLGKKDNVVPTIEGKDYKEADAYLETFGFSLGLVKEIESSLPKDVIVTQAVKAGTTAPGGTKIDVEVSNGKGKEIGLVPNLLGKTPDEAMQLISAAGYKIGTSTYEETDDVAVNLVIRQQYEAGTELEKDKTIDIVISKEISTPEPEEGEEDDNTDDDVNDGTSEGSGTTE